MNDWTVMSFLFVTLDVIIGGKKRTFSEPLIHDILQTSLQSILRKTFGGSY